MGNNFDNTPENNEMPNQGYSNPNAGMNQGYSDPNAGMNQGYSDPNAGMNQGYSDPNAGMNPQYTYGNENQQNMGGYNYSNNYQYNAGGQNSYQYGQPGLDNSPLSMGQWLLTILVLCVPCVGQVVYIVWAFSKTGNVNRRNFCRAALIIYLAIVILYLIFVVILGLALSSSVTYY